MLKSKGFSLLELLIALLIIAVGVLGHAKMQATSMQTAQRASQAQVANTALLDLAQRMRANSIIATHFAYSNLANGDSIATNKNCSVNDCTDAEFALSELSEWFSHLENNLPLPRFSVVKNGSLYTLTLIWDAAKTGAGSAVCDTNNANSHQCGSMDIWIP